ncbi:MAG: hypothetical protein AB7O44_28955 [Hyphomicrobiaceae bacterium]
MTLIEPYPAFRDLTEAEVLAALADDDPANPVAVEVFRLVARYAENFRQHIERLGYFPPEILRIKPDTAIETVAMRLVTERIRGTVDAAVMRGDATEH